jgi:hypothetical protein
VTKGKASSEEKTEIDGESETAEVEIVKAPAALDRKIAPRVEKETVAVAKSSVVGENGRSKVEKKSPEVLGTVVTGEPKSSVVAVNHSVVPVKLRGTLQNEPAKELQARKIAAVRADRPGMAGVIAHDAAPESARLVNESTPSCVSARLPEEPKRQPVEGSETKRITAVTQADRPATPAKISNSEAQKPAHTVDETAASRPGKGHTEPVSVESRAPRESEPTTTGIHIGMPANRENYVARSWAVHENPLGAAVVVPPSASNHPVSGQPRANARLDGATPVAGSSAVAPQVLMSGPTRLDVGVFDGTHGWLRVRAELGVGGTVNASLTASGAAHESLRAVLPEMASYLQSEAVSVSRIALHRAAAGRHSMTATEGQQSGGAQRQGEAGEQAQNGSSSLKKNLRVMEQRGPGSAFGTSRNATQTWIDGAARTMQTVGLGVGYSGGWLNVCV